MDMGKPQLLLVPPACPLPNFPGPQPPSLSPHLHAHISLYPSCQWLKMPLGLEPTSDISSTGYLCSNLALQYEKELTDF